MALPDSPSVGARKATEVVLGGIWLASSLAALVLPFGIFLILFILAAVPSVRRWRKVRILATIGLVIGVIRISSFCLLAHETSTLPMRHRSPGELASSLPPFSLLVYPDVGQFEANIVMRRSLVGKDQKALALTPFGRRTALGKVDSFAAIDPFTGAPYRTAADGQEYSIGPDLTDQQGTLLYDPTNGTFSTGDILVFRSRQNTEAAEPTGP